MMNFEQAFEVTATPLMRDVIDLPEQRTGCLSGGEQRMWRILQVLREDSDGLDIANTKALIDLLGLLIGRKPS